MKNCKYNITMSNGRQQIGNNVGNNNGGEAKVKSHYVAKDKEVITVALNGKQIEIRRIWDTKKKEFKQTLIQLSKENPDAFRRNLLIVNACLEVVGLKWADAPVKEVGKITWKEGEDEFEDARTRIKYLMNGGQVRVVRDTDGSQRVELDVVTERTVTQCIKDTNDWTEEDQDALAEHQAGQQRRYADRVRHERHEREYVHEFSCTELFTAAGL